MNQQEDTSVKLRIALMFLMLFTISLQAADDTIQLLRTAAEGGIADAQYELAQRLEAGDGLKKDQTEARHWYERAAKGGNSEAQTWVTSKAEADHQAAAKAAAQVRAAAQAKADAAAKAEAAARKARQQQQEAKITALVGPLVTIPAGGFQMGSNNRRFGAKPIHTVQLRSFRLMAFEITFAQYDAFASATGRELPDDSGRGRGNLPVFNVSWEDAAAYAQWVSQQTGTRVRLPSEAEWEYAARAGTTTDYWWGNFLHCSLANYGSFQNECFGVDKAKLVGSYRANPWGLFDTSGNVWEWVQDCYQWNYWDAPADGSAFETGKCNSRVARGGSWFNPGTHMESAHRGGFTTPARFDVGFRLAQDL